MGDVEILKEATAQLFGDSRPRGRDSIILGLQGILESAGGPESTRSYEKLRVYVEKSISKGNLVPVSDELLKVKYLPKGAVSQ